MEDKNFYIIRIDEVPLQYYDKKGKQVFAHHDHKYREKFDYCIIAESILNYIQDFTVAYKNKKVKDCVVDIHKVIIP